MSFNSYPEHSSETGTIENAVTILDFLFHTGVRDLQLNH